MSALVRSICILGILIAASLPVNGQKAESDSGGPTSIVITFKDGHQQTFLMSDVARVEYVGTTDAILGLDYFLGKWEVGDGSSSGTFIIALESSGEASKTLGASHGIWTLEGNDAHISWDDGWHDAIRKIGAAYEKFAFAPGTTFSDKPNNVAAARRLDSKSTGCGCAQ